MKTQPCSQKILDKKHVPVTVLKPSPLQKNPKLCWLGLFSPFPKRSRSLRKGEVMRYCKTSAEGIGGVRRADKWCMSHTKMGCSHPPSSLPLQKQNCHISTSPVLVLTQRREDGGRRICKAAGGRDRTALLAWHFSTGWKEGISSPWRWSPPVTPNAAALEVKDC